MSSAFVGSGVEVIGFGVPVHKAGFCKGSVGVYRRGFQKVAAAGGPAHGNIEADGV